MTEPTHIAYLTGEYPRATDTFIQREVAELRKQGFTVETTSIRRTSVEHLVGPEQREEAANTFYVINAAAKPMVSLRAHLRALRRPAAYFRALRLALKTSPGGLKATLYQLFYFAEAVVLAAHLQDKGVQHLHNHIAKASCTVAMLCHEISGIPYSFTLHGPDIFFEPIRWRLDEKIARASFTACISDFCRSQGMSFADRGHWDRMHIVHCGVDPERYAGQGDRAGNHLLFVGRLAAVKGLPVLFEAMTGALEHHPDLRLTLIGDGPERAALEAEAVKAGLADRVEFLGYKSQSEVAGMLQQIDALILPSFAEGVPVVLMEAMAAGLPVVTTQIAGIPELVEQGKSGILVPPGDAPALQRAISQILSDSGKANAMGQTGRAKVKTDFNITNEAAWLGKLIRGYLNGTPPQRKRPEGQE
ncbi:Glycosyltransferase KanE [Thalassovita gelatinovora]|uniref:Glycosyltransferase KanE n=1 Tax=Thalassovita gelatinovora TaxID=53501 RepID=A0A0P1F9F2_THAGE|nr:glycosyltransferase family 4 protein [Thalassovita gelatinovora]QIZ81175.1 glycosyltransferase [Thalassovita gelatinovora]CUH64773.1 Glycosyltransferase KanE [Thalassovita gelatinovora]SEP92325.1 Glycosyltransferase involved in cell wall bisynthesis [Thalassovita gelatinovora]